MNNDPDDSDRNETDADILNFDVDDAAIEIAAAGFATIPTASVNMVPPNCCVDRPARTAR